MWGLIEAQGSSDQFSLVSGMKKDLVKMLLLESSFVEALAVVR